MNRALYFDNIEEQLNSLAYRLEMRGKVNMLAMHLHSESFYQHLFNLTFGWALVNTNVEDPNAAGVDLVDDAGRLVAQVTATATKAKVEHALGRNLAKYKGYSFKFIAIAKSAEHLRTCTFANPNGLTFVPAKDVYDVPSLLQTIRVLPIEKQRAVSEFMDKELRRQPDPAKVETNLTALINRLSREDFRQPLSAAETIPYDVEGKIAYNHLSATTSIIADHKIHYPRLDRIYEEFDKQGCNRSLSVLAVIRAKYVTLPATLSPDDRFFGVITEVLAQLNSSAPQLAIPEEEIRLCVEILVVDAFIRCKIFRNPEGQANASP